MPHYKLTYFNLRGLAEGARLIFKHSGVDFEDCRLEYPPGDDWKEFKPKTPFGQVPILEIDGEVIAQSAAIYRYLGRQFGLVPKCPIEEALVDAIHDTHKDFGNEVRPYYMVVAGYVEGDKEKLEKEVFKPALEKYFAILTKFLTKSGSGFLVGKELTWADIVIADTLNSWTTSPLNISLDGYPEIKKFVEHVLAFPKIEKWIAERPKTKF